jgi:orotidine-5'-phosphate decarboxylase
LFILAATSNPESVDTQSADRTTGPFSGWTVAASIVGEVNQVNSEAKGLGSVGVVIGATANTADYGILAEHLIRTPILAPGFGEQGASVSDIPDLYGTAAANVIANVGRSVLRAGADDLAAAIARQSSELARALRG